MRTRHHIQELCLRKIPGFVPALFFLLACGGLLIAWHARTEKRAGSDLPVAVRSAAARLATGQSVRYPMAHLATVSAWAFSYPVGWINPVEPVDRSGCRQPSHRDRAPPSA